MARGQYVSALEEVPTVLIQIILPFLCVLGLLAATLIFAAQALTSWAFGWTRLYSGFLVELAVEPLPFGAHTLTHIDWSTNSLDLKGMMHSWTYAHPVAVQHLRTWVKTLLVATNEQGHR